MRKVCYELRRWCLTGIGGVADPAICVSVFQGFVAGTDVLLASLLLGSCSFSLRVMSWVSIRPCCKGLKADCEKPTREPQHE